jgi:hypothetical protein
MNKNIFMMDPSEEARNIEIDGKLKAQFPVVYCEKCRHRFSASKFEYPTIQPDQLPKISCDLKKTLSPSEFVEYRKNVQRTLNITTEFLPGSCYGQMVAKTNQELLDVSWVSWWSPLFSVVALNKLADVGIKLKSKNAEIEKKKQLISTHYSIQAGTSAMVSDKTLVTLTIERCGECGNFWKRNIVAKADGGWKLLRTRWPKGEHLVRLLEHGSYIIVSDEFKDAVTDLRLSGIVFTKIGTWCESDDE